MNEKLISPPWPGWETVKFIGSGSFGSVYEIRRKLLDSTEKAAMKVISIPNSRHEINDMLTEGYDEKSITDRFREDLKALEFEYSAMRKLKDCPNIVNCDDFYYVPHSDGIGWDVFIKMELLTPLGQALPSKIDESTIVKLALDMCSALEKCKSYNIVHRDIKPQNIFVSEEGLYKLGDFGVSKVMEGTTSGTKIGTYKYMAPEVYNNQKYSSTADIYSVGLVLYWLLNERRLPFLPLPPKNITATLDNDARDRRLRGEKLTPPAHGSKELVEIVLKACEYNAKDRYSSASEMRRALEKVVGASENNITLTETEDHDDVTDGKETGEIVTKPPSKKEKIIKLSASLVSILLFGFIEEYFSQMIWYWQSFLLLFGFVGAVAYVMADAYINKNSRVRLGFLSLSMIIGYFWVILFEICLESGGAFWHGLFGARILSVLLVLCLVLGFTPKNSKYIFGRDKGIRKVVFIGICTLIAILFIVW